MAPRGFCLSQREKRVLAAAKPQAELGVCGSQGQGCALHGMGFLLAAGVLSRLISPFPSDSLQGFSCFNAEQRHLRAQLGIR